MTGGLCNHHHSIFKIHIAPAKAANLPASRTRQDGEKRHRLVELGKFLIKRPELLRRKSEALSVGLLGREKSILTPF
jgi:hypothetical protein